MSETLTLPLYTQAVGQSAAPTYVMLDQYHSTARELIAKHVRSVLTTMHDRQAASRALQYVGVQSLEHATPDATREIEQAYTAWAAGSFLVLINGSIVENPDQMISLNEHSQVRFVRLVPLVGG